MSAPPDIRSLWIGHWPKSSCGAGHSALGEFQRRALVLDTCLRQLVVATSWDVAREAQRLHPAEVHVAAPAYRFLLEFATGLHSAVPGETNVFGQFKRAWQTFGKDGSHDAVTSLAPIVARLVCDTRRIRREHLQHIGGASYGTLVRRLLRPDAGDRILIVGTGELARALLPFFHGHTLGAWSRRPPGALFRAATRVFSPADGARAAAWATHVVMTTPPDECHDGQWRNWLEHTEARTIVHFGRRRGAPCPWPSRLRVFDLDDVFDLQRARANVRSLQIERARLACADRASRVATDPEGCQAQRVLA